MVFPFALTIPPLHRFPNMYNNGGKMNEKIAKVEQHLAEHPADYQSLISLMKLRSKEIENIYRLKKIERLKLIAECRKKLKANEERISE